MRSRSKILFAVLATLVVVLFAADMMVGSVGIAAGDVWAALEREKQLKRWRRSKKNWLVEMQNPQWRDLYPELLG